MRDSNHPDRRDDHHLHQHAAPGDAAGRVVVVGADELKSMIREAVRSALDAASERSDEWLGPDEVASLLGYKRSYVSELVRRRGLPAHRIGNRHLRFRRSEVLEWMEANRG